MSKKINNLSSGQKIVCNSCAVKNGILSSSTEYFSGLNSNDYVFFEICFNQLKKEEKVGKLLCSIDFVRTDKKIAGKIIKIEDTSKDYLKIAEEINGNEEVIERFLIPGYDLLKDENENYTLQLDLTRLVKDINSDNQAVTFAINFTTGLEESAVIYRPDFIFNKEIIKAKIYGVEGLDNNFKYDNCSFHRNGEANINLFTGKLIYFLGSLTSVGKNVPINFSFYHSKMNELDKNYLGNNLSLSFQYTINKNGLYYTLKDFTGYIKYYKNISRNDKDLLLAYGIKHQEATGDIYYCFKESSYMYVNENNIILYDKHDNKILFTLNEDKTLLTRVENALGNYINYIWGANGVESITNSDGETMTLSYTTEGKISSVSLADIQRYSEISEGVEDSYATTTIRTYTKDENEVETTLSNTRLYFLDNNLVKILDLITGQHMDMTYDTSNKVTQIGIYSSTEEDAEKLYIRNYIYGDQQVEVYQSYEPLHILYYFDSFGRLRTTIDSMGNAMSYEYIETEDTYYLLTKSQRNCAVNFVENGSFENGRSLTDGLESWKQGGNTGTLLYIDEGGVYGKKCLRLKSVTSDISEAYQIIRNIQPGTYAFTGYVKHPDTTGLTSSNTILRITGSYLKDSTTYVPGEGVVITTTNVTIDERAELDFSKKDWYYFETDSISIPTNAYDLNLKIELSVTRCSTDIYLDNIQLVDSAFKTRNNILENGHMEYYDLNNKPYGWNCTKMNENDQIETVNFPHANSDIMGLKAFHISSTADSTSEEEMDITTRKMFQEVNLAGSINDIFLFSILAKADLKGLDILEAFVTFVGEGENTTDDKHSFKFMQNLIGWQLLVKPVVANIAFTKIIVGIEYTGNEDVYIDAIELLKDSQGVSIEYDERGNITKRVMGNGNSASTIYNNDNQIIKQVDADGKVTRYKYNGKLLSHTIDTYGNKTEYTYDSSNRVISTIVTTPDGEEIVTSSTYNDATNQETYTDEFNKSTNIHLDSLNRLAKQIYPNNNVENFQYNKKSELQKLFTTIVGLSEETNSNTFSYDNKGNTTAIQRKEGMIYVFNYDTFGRILSISLNSVLIEGYEYDALVNGYRKGNLVKKTHSNGDYYEFTYNSLNQVTSISLNDTEIVKYKYNEEGNIHQVNDVSLGIMYNFTYDLKGNLLRVRSSDGENTNVFSYTYDTLGKVQQVTYETNNESRSINYEYESQYIDKRKEKYYEDISTKYHDEIIVGGGNGKGLTGAMPEVDGDYNGYVQSVKADTLDLSSKKLEYNLYRCNLTRNEKEFSYDEWQDLFKTTKTFYMWVKPTGTLVEKTIFTFSKKELDTYGLPQTTPLAYLKILSNGTLKYETIDSEVTYVSGLNLSLDSWQLIGVEFFIKDSIASARLIKNKMISTYFEAGIDVEDINYLTVSDETSNDLNLDVFMIGVSNNEHELPELSYIYGKGALALYYDDTKRVNGTIWHNEGAYENFDLIDFNGNFTSKKGIEPRNKVILEMFNVFVYDEELQRQVFRCFDSDEPYGVFARTPIEYSNLLLNEGTFVIKFKIEEGTTTRTLLSLESENNEVLCAYITTDNKLGFMLDGWAQTFNINISDNKWHTFMLRASNDEIFIDVDGVNYYRDQVELYTNSTLYLGNNSAQNQALNGYIEKVYVSDLFLSDEDKEQFLKSLEPITYRNYMDSLGRLKTQKIHVKDKEFTLTYTYDKTRVKKQRLLYKENHNTDYRTDCFMVGNDIIDYDCYISLIHFDADNDTLTLDYCLYIEEEADLMDRIEELNEVRYYISNRGWDTYGEDSPSDSFFIISNEPITADILAQHCPPNAMQSGISDMDMLGTYVMPTEGDMSYYDFRLVLKDGIETISYTYDDMSNITSRTHAYEGVSQIKSYEYDHLGRLTKEVFEDGSEEVYTYDTNGNILTIVKSLNNTVQAKEQYVYDTSIKDKLLRVHTLTGSTKTSIAYTGLYPTSINGTTLTWDGRRLVGYGTNTYTYNYEGVRIRKLTSTEDTTFVVEGSKIISLTKKLIQENDRVVKFDFVYDVSGKLLALIHNGQQYFYVRDIIGNILGLIDEEGEYIVKYKYDAWGKLLDPVSLEALTDDVAKHNPFIYKGYYYDVETGYFWLSSRYYSPELGRFIQPAEVSTLNPSSINGLNLYSYANNNPISIHYNTTLASAGIVGGGMVSSIGSSVGGGAISGSGGGGSSSPSRNLPSVPGWLGTLSTGLDHGFTMINPIRSAIACLQFTDLWDLMRLDGVTELPGALSKVATGIGWGLSIAGGVIAGYEKYASGASLSSSIAGGLINAGISIGGMYASTAIATAAMGALAASSLAIPGGVIIVGGAVIAVVAGIAINHLFTKLEIGGNTIEGHLNDFVDWLIFWD